jgi:hypothetical protein
MKEPKRLLEGGSPLERTILASARDDESPSNDLERRILAAMAAAPIAGAVSSPTLTRWLSTRTVIAGVAAIGVGALVVGGMLRRDPAPVSAPPVAAPITTAPQTADAPPAAAAEAPREVVMTPDSLPNAPARASAAAPPARAAATPAPSTASSASIAREIELLDGVKAKLGAGSASDAARALDAYDAEFPQGTLRPEATVLRIRTLLSSGDRAGAEKLGGEFLAKQPNGVHAKRVRALLEEK